MTIVYQQDQNGYEIIHYKAKIHANTIVLTRLCEIDEDTGYTIIKRGDRCIEWYYTKRWYSICEIHDWLDDHLKGWCCRFSHPAVMENDTIHVKNLLLRIWIDPDGKMVILNRDTFRALDLHRQVRDEIDKAIERLMIQFSHREPPFNDVPKATFTDPIEKTFVESWDAIERYYRTFFISDDGWDWMQPILRLIEELRKRGYDRKLSAHQALTHFHLSRSETLGYLGSPSIAITVNPDRTMDYQDWIAQVEVKAAPIEVTPELEQLLLQLSMLPTYHNPAFCTRGPKPEDLM